MSLITKSSVLVAVFLGMGVGSARAQERVVAKIPFPFVVTGKEFPAGRYAFSTDDHNVLLIRSADDRLERFALVHAAAGRDPAGSEPALVFIHYENEYLLSQIWESGADGLALAKEPDALKHSGADAQPLPSVVVAFGPEANGK
jgi:hypothetical protein